MVYFSTVVAGFPTHQKYVFSFQEQDKKVFSLNPIKTYPRVLPASLPRVSEPDKNQGESLVLPGLDVLPAPEPLFNFELKTKEGISVKKKEEGKPPPSRLSIKSLEPQVPLNAQGLGSGKKQA